MVILFFISAKKKPLTAILPLEGRRNFEETEEKSIAIT